MSSESLDSDDDCQLGKKEHWDTTYSAELENFEDHGDTGEIWFGEEVLDTMLKWTDKLLRSRNEGFQGLSILDLGTGNGVFLIRLSQLGYKDLTGCDYSAASIKLAKAVAASSDALGIDWVQDDILNSQIDSRFDVLTDKGTFDAVGLMSNATEHRIEYRNSVWKLLQPGGLLIITSCNNTAAELQEELCSKSCSPRFSFIDAVRTYPVFQFGGHSGSKVCTLAFQRLEISE